MKKAFLLFALFTFASVTGCKDMIDYGCHWDFNIKNDTEYDMVIEVISGRDALSPVTISPGSQKTAYRLVGETSTVGMIGERFPNPDEIMLDYPWQDLKITVNGEIIPEIIWTRKYWEFTDGKMQATYTLIVTNEFIESIKAQTE